MTDVKHGSELQIGDVVICGAQSRTITGFDDHPGLNGNAARILRSGDYGITVFDEDHFRLTSCGACIETHLWWHHEQK